MKHFFITIIFLGAFAFTASAQQPTDTRPDDFPTPLRTEKSLFFIQRNKNKNTIVYDANLKPDGNFDKSKPIDAYWIRHKSGKRDELKWIERTFAYGYDSDSDGKGGFWVELTAYDERKIHLKKNAEGKPVGIIDINGKQCKLEFIWVLADESSSWPKVIHVDIYGKDLATGKMQMERIKND